MNPVSSTIPVHSLMFQKAGASSHATRSKTDATQSAFADYGFGPADTGGGGTAAKGSVKPVTGNLTQAVQHSMPWVAQVQASGTTKA